MVFLKAFFLCIPSFFADAQCTRCGEISQISQMMDRSLSQYSLSGPFMADVANQIVNDESAPKTFIKFEKDEVKKIEDLLSVDYQAGQNGAILLMFRLPSDFKMNGKPQDSLSLNMGASNTYIRPQTIYDLESQGKLRPIDFFYNNPLKNRKSSSYSVDGVGQQWGIKRTVPIDNETEFGMQVRLFHMGTGNSLIAYPVSDKFIEKFHEYIGKNDPFGRKANGMNLIAVDMTDFDGNKIKFNKGKTFVLPIVFDLNRFATLQESETSKTTVKLGGHLGVPLQKEFGQLGAGLDCAITHNQMVSENYMVSAAVGAAIQFQKNVLGGYQPTPGIDRSHHETLAVAITRLDGDHEGKTSLVANYTQNSALLGKSYQPVVGIAGPVYSNRSVDALSADVMLRRDRAVELAVVRESKKWTVSAGVQEDLSSNPRFQAKMGSNSRDFTYFVSAKRKF